MQTPFSVPKTSPFRLFFVNLRSNPEWTKAKCDHPYSSSSSSSSSSSNQHNHDHPEPHKWNSPHNHSVNYPASHSPSPAFKISVDKKRPRDQVIFRHLSHPNYKPLIFWKTSLPNCKPLPHCIRRRIHPSLPHSQFPPVPCSCFTLAIHKRREPPANAAESLTAHLLPAANTIYIFVACC